MTAVNEIFNINMDHWIPGTRFFKTDDDKYFVVDADLAEYPTPPSIKFIRRNTVVLFCDENAVAIDSVPYQVFEQGDTAETVISKMGYTLEVSNA